MPATGKVDVSERHTAAPNPPLVRPATPKTVQDAFPTTRNLAQVAMMVITERTTTYAMVPAPAMERPTSVRVRIRALPATLKTVRDALRIMLLPAQVVMIATAARTTTYVMVPARAAEPLIAVRHRPLVPLATPKTVQVAFPTTQVLEQDATMEITVRTTTSAMAPARAVGHLTIVPGPTLVPPATLKTVQVAFPTTQVLERDATMVITARTTTCVMVRARAAVHLTVAPAAAVASPDTARMVQAAIRYTQVLVWAVTTATTVPTMMCVMAPALAVGLHTAVQAPMLARWVGSRMARGAFQIMQVPVQAVMTETTARTTTCVMVRARAVVRLTVAPVVVVAWRATVRMVRDAIRYT